MKELESSIEVKITPKCIEGKEPALTAEGFFLPCCWCDRRNDYFYNHGFLDSDLHISNVDDIVTEVFHSEPWIVFFRELQGSQKDIPSVCKEHCGVNELTNFKREL